MKLNGEGVEKDKVEKYHLKIWFWISFKDINTKEYVEQCVNNSLKRLQVDCIDLYKNSSLVG